MSKRCWPRVAFADETGRSAVCTGRQRSVRLRDRLPSRLVGRAGADETADPARPLAARRG